MLGISDNKTSDLVFSIQFSTDHVENKVPVVTNQYELQLISFS